MDLLQILAIASPILALAIVSYLFLRSGRPITADTVQDLYKQSESLASELEKVGLMAVASVEQLKSNGAIDTNEAAFQEAFSYINSWPGMEKLDAKLIARAVEGSYRLYKEMAKGKERGDGGQGSY